MTYTLKWLHFTDLKFQFEKNHISIYKITYHDHVYKTFYIKIHIQIFISNHGNK